MLNNNNKNIYDLRLLPLEIMRCVRTITVSCSVTSAMQDSGNIDQFVPVVTTTTAENNM